MATPMTFFFSNTAYGGRGFFFHGLKYHILSLQGGKAAGEAEQDVCESLFNGSGNTLLRSLIFIYW